MRSPGRPLLYWVAATLILGALVAEAAKPSLQAFFPPVIRDAAYQKRVFQKVASNWKSPTPDQMPQVGAKVVVKATVLRDGTLKQAGVLRPSKNSFWDEAGVTAVKAAAPFDPLPVGQGGASIDVNFEFTLVP